MSGELYTVEQTAARLKLHPKTVRRFVREGRLRAAKVGRSYRILRSDLDALAGGRAGTSPVRMRTTAIVDVPDADSEFAQRLGRTLSAARMGREAHAEPMDITVAHDPVEHRAKIVLVGTPEDVAAMLRLVQTLAEG